MYDLWNLEVYGSSPKRILIRIAPAAKIATGSCDELQLGWPLQSLQGYIFICGRWRLCPKLIFLQSKTKNHRPSEMLRYNIDCLGPVFIDCLGPFLKYLTMIDMSHIQFYRYLPFTCWTRQWGFEFVSLDSLVLVKWKRHINIGGVMLSWTVPKIRCQ